MHVEVKLTLSEDVTFTLAADGKVYLDIGGTAAWITLADLLYVTQEIQRITNSEKPALDTLTAPLAAPEGLAWYIAPSMTKSWQRAKYRLMHRGSNGIWLSQSAIHV